jgi:hypothetical protein
MGIDFVDLNFRIEKRFGVSPDFSLWEEVVAGRSKFDLTAGEVCDVVERCLSARRARLAAEAHDAAAGAVLPYQPPSEKPWMPQEPFEGDVWPAVKEVISATLSVPAVRIDRDTWLVRDLGMS